MDITRQTISYRIALWLSPIIVLCVTSPMVQAQTSVRANVSASGPQGQVNKQVDHTLTPGASLVGGGTTAMTGGASSQSRMNVSLSSGIAGNAHGCAGGGNEFAFGSGTGSARGSISTYYQITSTILPVRTPVSLTLQFFAYIQSNWKADIESYGDALNAGASVVITAGEDVGVIGEYRYVAASSGGPQNSPRRSGIFGDQKMVTFHQTAMVGGFYSLKGQLELYASAGANLETYNSVDILAGIQWSGSATDCNIINAETGTPFAAASGTPPISWDEFLPAYQFSTGLETTAPEPGAFAFLATGLLPLVGVALRHRKSAFLS